MLFPPFICEKLMNKVVLASILRVMYAISQQKQTPPLSRVFLPTVSYAMFLA